MNKIYIICKVDMRKHIVVFDKDTVINLRHNRLLASSIRFEAQEKNPEQALAVENEKKRLTAAIAKTANSQTSSSSKIIGKSSANVKTTRVLQLGEKKSLQPNKKSKINHSKSFATSLTSGDDVIDGYDDDGDGASESSSGDEQELTISFLLDEILPLQLSLEEAHVALEQGFINLDTGCKDKSKSSDLLIATWNKEQSSNSNRDEMRRLLNYPITDEDKDRCVVFKGLWNNGYTLVDGMKFGCDWLGYAGDPLRTHADIMIKVIPWEWRSKWERMRSLDLLSLVSVANKCKKIAVIASVDPINNEIAYLQCTRKVTNLPRRFGKRLQGGENGELAEAAKEVEKIIRLEMQQDEEEE